MNKDEGKIRNNCRAALLFCFSLIYNLHFVFPVGLLIKFDMQDCVCNIKDGICILGAGLFQVGGSGMYLNQYVL